MFGKLKEKLKNFFSSGKKEDKIELEPEEKVEKKKTVKRKEQEIGKKIWTDIVKEESLDKEQKGFFTRLRGKFSKKLSEEDFEKLFSELEFILFENNVALEVVNKIKKDLKEKLVNKEIKKNIEEDVKNALKTSIGEILKDSPDIIKEIKLSQKRPYVIVFFGINGAGKTTTIAKIANKLKKERLKIVLSASDTFRAASIEQLEKHASKLQIPIIKSNYDADPASVAFDAIKYAKAHDIDIVLIDTAGRMHSNVNLIREMEKIVRVAKPDLKVFVGESIAGNDIVEQVKIFDKEIGIDGIILSKADVDEKGGAALSVSYTTGKPILFLGIGQEYDKLEQFNKEKLINSIFSEQ